MIPSIIGSATGRWVYNRAISSRPLIITTEDLRNLTIAELNGTLQAAMLKCNTGQKIKITYLALNMLEKRRKHIRPTVAKELLPYLYPSIIDNDVFLFFTDIVNSAVKEDR